MAEKTIKKAVVVYPFLKKDNVYSPEYRLEEGIGLAQAIDLEVVHSEHIYVSNPKPATLLGSGVLDRIADIIEVKNVDVLIVDGVLSPVQQRNLENLIGTKVIDRTGLILEIFGARARTFEGKLQVELAALSYQRSRLVRAWTHLERQRGGMGFVGGPGESQLEIDRRLADDRITKIKRKLEDVKRTRSLQRGSRKKVPYPIVALVGYTNAGKSTLFNVLTGADVFAKDLLFATLDPTMRLLKLPCATEIIMSDTVGFISDLPHDLVASFRATLEEVQSADIILHIRDLSSDLFNKHGADVNEILENLDVFKDNIPVIEVWNKIDNIADSTTMEIIEKNAQQKESSVLISALTGQGLEKLSDTISTTLRQGNKIYEVVLPLDAGAENAWIQSKGKLVSQDYENEKAILVVELSMENSNKFFVKFPETSAKMTSLEK